MQNHDISLTPERITLRHDTTSAATPISITVEPPGPGDAETRLSLDHREAAVLAFLLAGGGGSILFRKQLLTVDMTSDEHGNDAAITIGDIDRSEGREAPIPIRAQETAELLYAIIGL